MSKWPLTLLLLRGNGDGAALRRALRAVSAPGLTAMVHTGEDIPGNSPHGQLMAGQEPFDAAIFCEGDSTGVALRKVAADLGHLIDHARSAAVSGTVHDITAGSDALRLVFALRRRHDLSLAEFREYWLNNHAEIPRKSGHPPGYHQLHADPQASRAAAEAAGIALADYDGVALFKCPDFERMKLSLHHPATLVPLEDERRFIDHSRSVVGPFSPCG